MQDRPFLALKILFLNMRHWYIIFPGSPDLLQFFPFNLIELKYILENPDSSGGKESACHAEDPVSIPGSGRSAGERIGYPLQYSGLENSMDWIVHDVAKSRTQLSNFHFYF